MVAEIFLRLAAFMQRCGRANRTAKESGISRLKASRPMADAKPSHFSGETPEQSKSQAYVGIARLFRASYAARPDTKLLQKSANLVTS